MGLQVVHVGALAVVGDADRGLPVGRGRGHDVTGHRGGGDDAGAARWYTDFVKFVMQRGGLGAMRFSISANLVYWFGWPCDKVFEDLRKKWAFAPDQATRKQVAVELSRRAYEQIDGTVAVVASMR